VPHSDKIRAVQKVVVEKNAMAILITMLDEIAWLFNIRGSDISFNPVTIAYAVVTRDSAVLFIDAAKVTPEISAHLGSGVQLRPYEDICSFLKEIVSQGSGPVLMDPSRVNWGVYLAAEEGDSNSPEEKVASSLAVRVVDTGSPITLKKSLKNESELAGIRACHVRDGVALTAFLHWLESTVQYTDQQVRFHIYMGSNN
jgi:Xaa-Pro aminopeptidase